MSIALLWSCVTVGGGETLVYSEFQSRSCVISSEELESENISVSRVWERRKPGGFRQWQTTFCRRPFTSCRETGTASLLLLPSARDSPYWLVPVSYLKKWKVRCLNSPI
ncbi:uncharacterized protein LOC144327188 isoform X3 [Podarcis muralis]